MEDDYEGTYPWMPLNEVLESLTEEIPGRPGMRKRDTVTLDIRCARKLIAESKGRLTWYDAGETWARVCLGDPEEIYPDL